MTDDHPAPGPDAEDPRAVAAFRDAFARNAAEAPIRLLDPVALALQSRVRQRPIPDAAGPGSVDSLGSLGSGHLAAVPDAAAPAGTSPDAPPPHTMRPRERRRTRVGRGLIAAAAVLVVAVPVGLWSLGQSGARDTMSAVPGAPAPAAEQAGSGGAPAAAGGEASAAGGLPAARAGYRYESFRDVVVQVPSGWGYAQAPGADWCAARGATPEPVPPPYVALKPGPVLAILCPGDVPADRQQTHLEWRAGASGDADGDVTKNGWVYSGRLVGTTFVTVVHRPREDVSAILGSARLVTVDHNGCAVTGGSGDRPARSASGSSPTAVVLCQYDGLTGSPNLVTSTRLTGAAASGLWKAMEASARIAAPASEAGCLPQDADVTRIVARFSGESSPREVWLTLGGCRTPLLDDGETYRLPSRPACRGAFVPPLARWTWQGSAVGLCAP